MNTTHPIYQGLPASIRAAIDAWRASLEAALGDDLVSIMLTGGVARGDYTYGESDVSAIVVLRDAAFAKLDAISEATQTARYAARVAPTFLTLDEIPGAGDAFPLLFDEIKRWHIVIHGADTFASIVVHDTHRRLRIEQELREAQVWLRRVVTDSVHAREAIAGSVARKVRQVRRPLAALLALRNVACSTDMASVFTCAGARFHVDIAPLLAPNDDPAAAHTALTTLLAAAIRDIGQPTGPDSLRAPRH